MMETKPFASLSSGLLARKGAAKPAMRPQGFGQFGGGLEDLGWNDMGQSAAPQPVALSPYEIHEEHVPSPISALTPMGGSETASHFEPSPPIVEQQRAAIEATFSEPVEDSGEERKVLATKLGKLETQEVTTPNGEDVETEAVCREPSPVVHLPRARPSRASSPKQAVSKAAFTLRLEAERHLRLRLACAVTGRSAQQILVDALDQLLAEHPEIEALAGQVPAKVRKSH